MSVLVGVVADIDRRLSQGLRQNVRCYSWDFCMASGFTIANSMSQIKRDSKEIELLITTIHAIRSAYL